MDNARYGGARAAASRVAAHFANHIKAAETGGLTVAPAPGSQTLESIIDAAFWASLKREEGYTPKISLAYLPPELAVRPIVFERPIALAAATLAKVSPAV